jgi:hypothetical protein
VSTGGGGRGPGGGVKWARGWECVGLGVVLCNASKHWQVLKVTQLPRADVLQSQQVRKTGVQACWGAALWGLGGGACEWSVGRGYQCGYRGCVVGQCTSTSAQHTTKGPEGITCLNT